MRSAGCRSEIGARRDADRPRRADVGDLDQRARPRIALAEEQEVVRLLLREHREVRLHEPSPIPEVTPLIFPLRMSARISRGCGGRWHRRILPPLPETGHTSDSRARPASRHAAPQHSPATCSEVARRASCVTPATWDETTTFGRLKSGLSIDVGSSSKTSMPAPPGARASAIRRARAPAARGRRVLT